MVSWLRSLLIGLVNSYSFLISPNASFSRKPASGISDQLILQGICLSTSTE
jgi:hypothetical protein